MQALPSLGSNPPVATFTFFALKSLSTENFERREPETPVVKERLLRSHRGSWGTACARHGGGGRGGCKGANGTGALSEGGAYALA